MRTLTARSARRFGDTDDPGAEFDLWENDGVHGTELWMRLARFSIVLALVDGYGAYAELLPRYKPLVYGAAQLGLLTAALLVSPLGQYRKLVIPLPALLYGLWWMASYAWTVFPAGFINSNAPSGANVAVLVILGGMVPRRFVVRSVLTAGYVAVALIAVALLVQPSLAFTSADSGAPVPGLRGGFIHKNLMTSCVIVTMVAVFCFERRTWIRRVALPLTVVLVVLSQSDSGLSTLAVILAGYWLVARWDEFVGVMGRAAASVAAIAIVVGSVALGFAAAELTAALGKDLTFSGRDRIWEGTVSMIKRRPIEGYGGQNLFVILSAEPASTINRPLGYIVRHSHNAALETWLRLGVVGLSLLLLQILTTLRTGFVLLRSGTAKPLGRFVVLLVVTVVAFGVSEIHTVFGSYLGLLIIFGSKSMIPPGVERTSTIR